MTQPAFQITLTEADRDHIVAVYRELGSMELTQRKIRLPYNTVREVLVERKALKRRKGAAKRGVVEKESDGPVVGAAQIGPRPLFDIVRETLVGFDQSTMRYKGRVWNLDLLMQEVNRQRRQLGMPQVDYNPAWLV